MRWNFRQIEVFIAVLEEGGFTAAGERLNMVQPAVSIAIRKLEESAGVKLVDRSAGKVRATREGELFLRQIQMVRSELVNLSRQLREMRALESGHILIGAPPILAGFFLPPIVGEFLTRHPGINLALSTGSSQGTLGRLRERDLDVGIVAGDHDMSGLEAVLIERHPIVACCAKSSPIADLELVDWERLLDEPMVIFPSGYNQRSIVNRMASALGKPLKIAIESDSARFVSAMVAAGLGVSVVLGAVVSEFPDVVRVPIADKPTLPIWLCRREGTAVGLAANALFEDIVAGAQS